MVKRVVIVGGGAAGIDVLDLLLRSKEDAEEMELTLIKKEKEGYFSTCGLPFALQGMYSIKELELIEPSFYRDKGVDFGTGFEVTGINLENGYVSVDTGEDRLYDYLVIATGSKPFIPPIEGTTLEGVYTLTDKEDGDRIEAAMNANPRNALIIGGGLIGLQAAVAFSKKGDNYNGRGNVTLSPPFPIRR